jgi:hypothetical protein
MFGLLGDRQLKLQVDGVVEQLEIFAVLDRIDFVAGAFDLRTADFVAGCLRGGFHLACGSVVQSFLPSAMAGRDSAAIAVAAAIIRLVSFIMGDAPLDMTF